MNKNIDLRKKFKSGLRALYRYIVYRERRSSETYIDYLRRKGMRIGEEVKIMNPPLVHIDETRPQLIELGNQVIITDGVTILTHGYDGYVLEHLYHRDIGSAGKVKIGNNVFIGMKTTILKDVDIGDNVIIGANSCVTRNVPSNSVVAGNPARVISSIENYFDKRMSKQYGEALTIAREWIECVGG